MLWSGPSGDCGCVPPKCARENLHVPDSQGVGASLLLRIRHPSGSATGVRETLAEGVSADLPAARLLRWRARHLRELWPCLVFLEIL